MTPVTPMKDEEMSPKGRPRDADKDEEIPLKEGPRDTDER